MNRRLSQVIRTLEVVRILVADGPLLRNWKMFSVMLDLSMSDEISLEWGLKSTITKPTEAFLEILNLWISGTGRNATLGNLVDKLRIKGHNDTAARLVISFGEAEGETAEFRNICIVMRDTDTHLQVQNEVVLNRNQVNAIQVVRLPQAGVMDIHLD